MERLAHAVQCFVARVAESENDGVMSTDALLAKLAGGKWVWLVHGESGFNRLLAGWVHDFGAGLVVEQPSFALVNGCAIHNGNREQVVAVVLLLDLHELAGGGDREFFLCDGFLEVCWQGTEEHPILHPRRAMVRKLADLALGQAFYFRQHPHCLGFFERVHVQAHQVFSERRDLIQVLTLDDACGDCRVAEQFAGGQTPAAGDEPPASTYAGADDQGLQQAVRADRVGQDLNALVRDRFTQGRAVHVDLIDVDVLFQFLPPSSNYFDTVRHISQVLSYAQFSPQSPLSSLRLR